MIRKWIGRLTRPDNFYADEYGNTWVSCHGIPSWSIEVGYYTDYTYRFTYQEVKQNWLGVWVVTNSWFGTSAQIERGDDDA